MKTAVMIARKLARLPSLFLLVFVDVMVISMAYVREEEGDIAFYRGLLWEDVARIVELK